MKNKKLFLLLLAFVLLLCVGCTDGGETEGSENNVAGTVVTQSPSAETEIETGTGSGGESDAVPSEEPSPSVAGDVSYTLKFVDQKGWGIEGVVVKVCNADACVMAVSDENGLCELMLPASTYEVQLLNIPEGYELTDDTLCTAPVTGGELVVTLRRK